MYQRKRARREDWAVPDAEPEEFIQGIEKAAPYIGYTALGCCLLLITVLVIAGGFILNNETQEQTQEILNQMKTYETASFRGQVNKTVPDIIFTPVINITDIRLFFKFYWMSS